MKLSNKILIGFFGFIFLYLSAAFTEMRFRGFPKIYDKSVGITETVELSNLSYLVIDNLNHHITVLSSDEPRIDVQSMDGNLLKYLQYSIEGDTLIISELDLPDNGQLEIYVYMPERTFRGITANNSRVYIKELKQDQLSISQNDGSVTMSEIISLKNLQIVIRTGQFYLTSSSVDTLSADLDDSRATIRTNLKLAEGSLTNKSNINMSGTKEIRMKKDDSSRIFLD